MNRAAHLARALRAGIAPLSALAAPLLAAVAFAPGVSGSFLNLDDPMYVRDNPDVARPEGLRRIWTSFGRPDVYQNQPLTFTTYWLEYRLWGSDPRGYRATNVLLHATNALLLYAALRRLTATRAVAAISAALFAVHPAHVATVGWIAERKNLLATLFMLVALLAYARAAQAGGARAWLGAAAAFVAALLSKTAVMGLPISLYLADRVVLGGRGWRPVLRAVPLLLLAVVAAGVSKLFEHSAEHGGPALLERPLHSAAALWFYAGKIVWPEPVSAMYGTWQVDARRLEWWLPAIGVAAAAALVLALGRRLAALSLWGLGHFVVLIAPALGLVWFGFLNLSSAGLQYVYLASFGLLAAIVNEAARALSAATPGVRRAFAGVAAAAVALAALRSAELSRVWCDSCSLWRHTLAHAPDSAAAHALYGSALGAAGDAGGALAHCRRAVALNPGAPDLHDQLGRAFERLGDDAAAAESFRAALALAATHVEANFNLAGVLVRAGRLEEARAHLERAVQSRPDLAAARTNLGMVLVALGRPEEALPHLRAAAELSPGDPRSRERLAELLARIAQTPRGSSPPPPP